MSASVIFSYAFMYFVLFLVVPFILVTFTLTCIKFFKNDSSVAANIKLRPLKFEGKATGFISKLNAIVKGKYQVLYGTSLDSIVDIDKTDKAEDAHSYLQTCHLDYVVMDSESSAVKLVITDPQHNSEENSQFIDNSLSKMGVKVIHLAKNQYCDENLIKRSLAA